MKRFTRAIKKLQHISDRVLYKPTKLTFSDSSLLDPNDHIDMKVYATSVIRGSQDHELTGYLYEIRWIDGIITRKIPIPIDTKHPFWNARGGNRGGRGLFHTGEKLYAATAMSILEFDNEMNQVGEINHPYFGDIHEIFVVDDGIWVTSTIHDLVLKVDFSGSTLYEWYGSKSKILQKRFGYKERDLKLNLDFPKESFETDFDQYKLDEIFHINSVWVRNGETFILSCYKNALIKIFPGDEEIIAMDNSLHFPHNGILTPQGTILVNDTKNQYLREYDFDSGKRIQTLSTSIDHQDIRGSAQFSRAGWQRGLTHVVDSIFLVGTSPATIFEVDIRKGIIGKVFSLEIDVSNSVHGLCVQ